MKLQASTLTFVVVCLLLIGGTTYFQMVNGEERNKSLNQFYCIDKAQTTEENKKNQEIDSKLLFEIDSKSLKFIVEQSKVVAAFFYDESYPNEFEEMLSQIAKDIATQRLAQSLPVAIFGTVNTHEDSDALQKYGIKYEEGRKYKLILFINQFQINYEGQYTKESIKQFIDDKLNNSIKEITSEEELQKYLVRDRKKVLIGSNNSTFIDILQKKEQNFDLFTNSDTSEVKLITNQDLLKSIPQFKDIKFPFICFIKDNQFPEERQFHFYEGSFYDVQEIRDYVFTESINLVEEMSAESYQRVFGTTVENQIHLFIDPNVDNTQIINQFRFAALQNKQDGKYPLL